MTVYIVMLNLGPVHENHCAGVFSSSKLAQEYCDRRNAEQKKNPYSRYRYEFHSRVVDEKVTT
jgi:hypothetical protein